MKHTHISTQRELFARNKKEVQKRLGITELQYGNFQYNCGIGYLRHNMQLDEWGINALIRQRIFWQWWINEWNLRDERIFLSSTTSQDPKVQYYHIHHWRAINRTPDAVVLSESYACIVEELNNEIKTACHE